MIWYLLGAFTFGCLYAIAVVYFYRAVNEERPGRAAGWDLLIGGLTVAPLQFWALSGSSGWVLAAEVLGSAVGTYVTLKWVHT